MYSNISPKEKELLILLSNWISLSIPQIHKLLYRQQVKSTLIYTRLQTLIKKGYVKQDSKRFYNFKLYCCSRQGLNYLHEPNYIKANRFLWLQTEHNNIIIDLYLQLLGNKTIIQDSIKTERQLQRYLKAQSQADFSSLNYRLVDLYYTKFSSKSLKIEKNYGLEVELNVKNKERYAKIFKKYNTLCNGKPLYDHIIFYTYLANQARLQKIIDQYSSLAREIKTFVIKILEDNNK